MQTLFFPLQIMYSRSFVALEAIPSHHSAPAPTFLMSPLSPNRGDIKNASAQNNLCPLKIIIFWSTWSILLKLNGRYFFKKPIEEGKISQLPPKKKKKKGVHLLCSCIPQHFTSHFLAKAIIQLNIKHIKNHYIPSVHKNSTCFTGRAVTCWDSCPEGF